MSKLTSKKIKLNKFNKLYSLIIESINESASGEIPQASIDNFIKNNSHAYKEKETYFSKEDDCDIMVKGCPYVREYNEAIEKGISEEFLAAKILEDNLEFLKKCVGKYTYSIIVFNNGKRKKETELNIVYKIDKVEGNEVTFHRCRPETFEEKRKRVRETRSC